MSDELRSSRRGSDIDDVGVDAVSGTARGRETGGNTVLRRMFARRRARRETSPDVEIGGRRTETKP